MKKTTQKQLNMNIFPVGTSFAPVAKATEVPLEEWEQDVRTMKNLGLNIYRLFIAWDRIERKRGEFDFSKADHSFRLAEKYGIKVIAMVGGSGSSFPGVYAPRWLYRELGATLRRTDPFGDNLLRKNNFRLCYDDPVLQCEMERFVRLVVNRYKNSSALMAWAPCNEVGERAECQCPHTLRLYREFLKAKYRTLEALSEAWGSENPMDFVDWSEVFPATSAGFKEGGYQMFLDYREFQEHNRDGIFNLVSDWIHNQDPSHPIIVHYNGALFADTHCRGDIVATSTYLYFSRRDIRYDMSIAKRNQEWNYNSALFQLNSEPWRADRNGFWQMEAEGGPTYWVHNMMPRSFSGRMMNARDMLFVSHGARCIMRWMYRSRQTDSQAGEFNLVGWDGSVLERSKLFGKLAMSLNEHKKEFLSHEPESYQVAMLHRDWNIYWRWQMEDVDRYWNTYLSVYSMLCDAGVRPKVMSQAQLEAGALDGIKLLIIPFRPWISSKMGTILKEFVAQGGYMAVESPFAIKDMSGVHQLVTPGFGLTEVFGCRIVDMDKVFDNCCGDLPCLDFKTIITPMGCQVESVFADGKPAVITHRYGDGAVQLYASQVFERYSEENAAVYRKEIEHLFDWAGVKKQYQLEDISESNRLGISINPRHLPDGRKLIFVVNLNETPVSCTLKLPAEIVYEILCDSGNNHFERGRCELEAVGWMVLIGK